MAKFYLDDTDVKKFMKNVVMHEQQGIAFAFSTPEEVIVKLLPEELEARMPFMTGYVGMIKGTCYSGPFMESGVGVPVKVKATGDCGNYFISYMVHGPGAFNASCIGSDYMGTPKKYADDISCWRNGTKAGAKVVRNGVAILEISMDVDGNYNTYAGGSVLGEDPKGTTMGSNLYYRFGIDAGEDGSLSFSNGHIVKLDRETDIRSYEKGKLTSVTFRSTENDPYEEFVVTNPVGAAFYNYKETRILKVAKVLDTEAGRSISKLLTARYDRGMFGDMETYLDV